MDVIRKTIAADGVRGMYKGLESTVWRHVMWSAFDELRQFTRADGGYFGCIFSVKAKLPKATTKTGQSALARRFG